MQKSHSSNRVLLRGWLYVFAIFLSVLQLKLCPYRGTFAIPQLVPHIPPASAYLVSVPDCEEHVLFHRMSANRGKPNIFTPPVVSSIASVFLILHKRAELSIACFAIKDF
jgi:hypothetical protein